MKTLIYRINTQLMHVFFVLEDHLPHKIFWRFISRRALKDVLRGNLKSRYVRMFRRHQTKVVKSIVRNFRKGK